MTALGEKAAQLDGSHGDDQRPQAIECEEHPSEDVSQAGDMRKESDLLQHEGAPDVTQASPGNKEAPEDQANEKSEQPLDGNASEPHNKEEPKQQGPPGGYDASRIPHASPGYTVKITFHRASALPIGDAFSLSSDPYLTADLQVDLPTRHKEDPPLRFRSRTIFRTTAPVWEEEWILEHIPASGFKLKVRIYDEDRGDADDRLGNVHVAVGRLDEKWEGIRDQGYKIKKRMGSKRAYLLRAIAVCMRQAEEMSGNLHVSVEVLGRSPGDEGGRAYTLGLNYWCKHYSPLLGRITGSKTTREEQHHSVKDEGGDKPPKSLPDADGPSQQDAGPGEEESHARPPIPGTQILQKRGAKKKTIGRYNFQANQIQLKGPVPPELYHRFVEFRPFIKALFTASGIRGIIMKKALHHQHAQVYNFNRDTEYGVFRNGPCEAMTQRFLDLCHHDEGGRMFTYVITLDALMRFTETGKEFGIDLLSKHTMHSDASIYIAYSGEFFIRRREDARHHHARRGAQLSDGANDAASDCSSEGVQPQSNADILSSDQVEITESERETHTTKDKSPASNPPPSHPVRSTSAGNTQHSPAHYELVIDNDSGTYRPNAALLPLLHSFLSSNFPGLKIVTLDCQADAELMNRLKTEQREKKAKARERAGGPVVYTQASSSASSLSSSDVDRIEQREEDAMLQDRHRRNGGAGTADGRTGGEGSGGRKAPPVDPPKPKHKVAEAVLPYVQNEKLRDALTTKSSASKNAE